LGLYKLVLYNAVAIRLASQSNSRMPRVRQIARFCITNSSKTKGKTCPVLQIYTLNFYSQVRFIVAGWLLGWGTGQLLYNFRGRGVTRVRNVTLGRGVLKNWCFFCYIICALPLTVCILYNLNFSLLLLQIRLLYVECRYFSMIVQLRLDCYWLVYRRQLQRFKYSGTFGRNNSQQYNKAISLLGDWTSVALKCPVCLTA